MAVWPAAGGRGSLPNALRHVRDTGAHLNGNGMGLSGWGWRVAGFLFGGVVALGAVWVAHPMSREDVRQVAREEVTALVPDLSRYSREREALIGRLDRGDQDRTRLEAKLDEIAKNVQQVANAQAEINGSLKAFLGRVDGRR